MGEVISLDRKTCACNKCESCTGFAEPSEFSPHMDDYCNNCTWIRCDLPDGTW